MMGRRNTAEKKPKAIETGCERAQIISIQMSIMNSESSVSGAV